MLEMTSLDLHQKKVLVRVDMNVPRNGAGNGAGNGAIRDDQRIRACLPTINGILQENAAVILLSHSGRPLKGQAEAKFSLAPVAKRLEELVAREVRFTNDYLNGIVVAPGELVMCENVRFNAGEQENDSLLAHKLAELGDVFAMDAFAVAHRNHASTCGITRYAPLSCAGPLLCAEVKALEKARCNPARPLLVIVGGSKVSTKFTALEALADQADSLIPGGGIANTFLAAAGYPIGASLYEAKWVSKAQTIMQKMRRRKKHLVLPEDAVCATGTEPQKMPVTRKRSEIEPRDMIMDIGPQTIKKYTALISQAKTIVWNGPPGVFENPAFAAGTRSVAAAVADSSAFSIAGGGDTLAAMAAFKISGMSYVSTGGGAFLEFMERGQLAALTELGYRG